MNFLKMMLVCACLAMPAMACAELVPLIPTIVSIITDAVVVIETIDGVVQEHFRAVDVSPEVRAAYTQVHSRCLAALNAANHALRGAEKLDQKQFDAAFDDFDAAYRDLRVLLEKEGLLEGDRLKAGGTEIVIPDPEVLTYRVR
jgi:hypothetical protein